MRRPHAPAVVLGIVDGLHDAGAALVVDGRLLAAANEERFTREKLDGGMPDHSIASVLRQGGIDARDVDRIAVGGVATPTVATRLVRPLQALYRPSLGVCFDRPWHPVDRLGDLARYRLGLTRSRAAGRGGRLEGILAERILARTLPPGVRTRPLAFVDHHRAHAESAWRTAGPGRWLVVTADAHGDGRSLTVWTASEDAGLTLLHQQGVGASLGAFYSLVTRRLGFRPGRHEGKVLGLSARGRADRVPFPWPFAWDGETLLYRGRWGLAARRELAPLSRLPREDVAAWVQEGTERMLLEGVRRWLRQTGLSRVAVAGGVFANVRVNGRIAALDEVERLHVFPHMGDGGLAVGAALSVADAPPRRLASLTALGPAPTDAACGQALLAAGLSCVRPPSPDRLLAEALERGLPVVRYVGGMEYGPRALGHRSVLAPADDPGITVRLGAALCRDEFMPFAPAILAEDAPAAFEHLDAAGDAARFMTVALPAKLPFRSACPAAVHVDGTARPQVVHHDQVPGFCALIRAVRDATGRPAVINTSFNMHEEPIVHTPADAVRAFRASRLPRMRLGPYVVDNPASAWWRDAPAGTGAR